MKEMSEYDKRIDELINDINTFATDLHIQKEHAKNYNSAFRGPGMLFLYKQLKDSVTELNTYLGY